MVAALVLGTSTLSCVGSSPSFGTKKIFDKYETFRIIVIIIKQWEHQLNICRRLLSNKRYSVAGIVICKIEFGYKVVR